MKKTAAELFRIIEKFTPLLGELAEKDISSKPRPEKWSRKEILGHLVDSAQNNLRRFIVAQYDDSPKIVYRQDFWVAISDYAHTPAKDLIALWRLLNLRICAVLENTPEANAGKLCRTNDPAQHTIAWLAEDYLKHLLHHMHQVLELEPVPYP